MGGEPEKSPSELDESMAMSLEPDSFDATVCWL